MLKTINRQDKLPLYAQLEELIKRELIDEHSDIHLPIMPELAITAKYNVSRITVRRAIDNLIKEGKLYKKHGVGTFVLKKKTDMTIVYVLYHLAMLSSSGRGEIIQVIQEVAEKNGCNVIIKAFNKNQSNVDFYDFFMENTDCGYLFSVQELSPEDIAIIRSKCPMSVFTHCNSDLSVTANVYAGGAMAAEHSQGKTLLLAIDYKQPDTKKFIAGFNSVKSIDNEHVVKIDLPYSEVQIETILEEYFANNPYPETVVASDFLGAKIAKRLLKREHTYIISGNENPIPDDFKIDYISYKDLTLKTVEMLCKLMNNKEIEERKTVILPTWNRSEF